MTALRRLFVVAIFALALSVAPSAWAAASVPVLSGSVSDPLSLSGATSVAVSGHYAYTTAYYAGTLTAIDFSNPAAPVIAGQSAFSNALLNASTVNISGGFAYVASKNRNGPNGSGSNNDGTGNSLTILDVSTNPAQPQIVGTVTDATKLFGAYGAAVSGNYAYVAAQGCLSGQPCPVSTVGDSFEVIDVSNPLAPKIVASLRNSLLPAPWAGTNALQHACSVTVSGHYAYVTAAYSNRLTIIDIANPLAPVIVSSLLDNSALAFPVDVAVKGNYAYVADQAQSLGRVAVVDVSNPANPVIAATLTNASFLDGAYRIRVHGNFAYVSAVYAATMSALDISNPLKPRVAGHLTDTAHLNRTTGVDVDPTGTYAISSSNRLASESSPLYPPFPPATGSSSDTGTISVIQLDPAAIGVSISAKPASTTTATGANFTFASTDTVSAMSCAIDGGAPGSCASSTTAQYTGLAQGAHTFTVQAADAANNTASTSYAWSILAAPVNTVAPTMSGTASQGSQLSASTGTWTGTPSPAFSYQWSRCDGNGANCAAISGAISANYTTVAADTGSTLKATVTGKNSVGSSSASTALTAVVSSAPVNTAAPSISGTASQGSQLTASTGTWTGTPSPTYAYQWSDCDGNGANCTAISGATTASYTAQATDAGLTLEVTVTGTNSAGSATATSAATAVVSSGPVNTAIPSISGSPSQGQTLTAANGSWSGSPAPSYAYQWSACDPTGANCAAISGATASTYVVQASDVGSTLEITVTATNGSGSSSATSLPTNVATSAPANTAPPSVSGTASQGQVLTASNGAWTGLPSPAFTYQWSVCDSGGASCTNLSGASSSTYTAQSSDVGSTLKVTVTGTNTVGSSSATSAATTVITSGAANTALPSVSGSAVEGKTLSTTDGTWTGVPAPTFAYQWSDCGANGTNCSPISGAQSATYTAVAADVGFTLEVTVTGSNPAGSNQATSAPTAIVTSAAGPVTALLDDFNRANNAGPPGANWTHTVIASSSATSDTLIKGQQITGMSNLNGADYWNPRTFGPDSEAWITVVAKPTVDQDSVSLGLRVQNPASASTSSGYQAYYVFRSTPPDQYKIMLRASGQAGGITLASGNGPTLSPGDQLLFRAIGSTLELWRQSGTTWTRILTATNSTIPGAGYLMVSARNTAVRLDNFGGGTLP